MNEITYTQIMPNDIDDVIRIERATFSENEALSVESMIERINLIPDSFIAARNSEGTVVGYVSGPVTEGRYLDDESFERTEANPKTGGFQKIISLTVDPDYQGLGIATNLLLLLEKEAKSKKRLGISLTCHDYLVPYYENMALLTKDFPSQNSVEKLGTIWSWNFKKQKLLTNLSVTFFIDKFSILLTDLSVKSIYYF